MCIVDIGIYPRSTIYCTLMLFFLMDDINANFLKHFAVRGVNSRCLASVCATLKLFPKSVADPSTYIGMSCFMLMCFDLDTVRNDW